MNQTNDENFELDTTEQSFANSPTMLALCLTVIGLIKIYATLQRVTTLADNFLALSLVAFLLSTIFSYLALRASTRKLRQRLARIADGIFLAGLSSATVVAVFIAFSLAG